MRAASCAGVAACRRLLGSRLQYQVERRLGGAPESSESHLVHNLCQSRFTRLCAKRRTDVLRQRVLRADDRWIVTGLTGECLGAAFPVDPAGINVFVP